MSENDWTMVEIGDLIAHLDKIDDAHNCTCSHRVSSSDFDFNGGVGFSAYACPTCLPMIYAAVNKVYGPDYETVTVQR